MTDKSKPPFSRVELHDGAELVGARWWQESLALYDPIARRKALIGIAAGVAAVAPLGMLLSTCGPEHEESLQESLLAQRSFGWNVGSETEALALPAEAAVGGFDRKVLDTLVSDLAPPGPLRPYYVPTLFQSVTAVPSAPTALPAAGQPLREALRPLKTASMAEAEGQGRALASLLALAPPGRAVVVDLPGPESVAFAAGLAGRCCPVFLFDNWPHPKGVVPAHLVLCAVMHYAGHFAAAAKRRRPESPPVFVLDRNRLKAYEDQSDRFDNRYLARLPTAVNLYNLSIGEVIYVREDPGDLESDDLNADFVAYQGAGIKVRLVAQKSFTAAAPEPAPAGEGTGTAGGDVDDRDDWDEPVESSAAGSSDGAGSSGGARPRRYYYGGGPRTHWFFFTHYGWGAPPRPTGGAPPAPPVAVGYAPRTRTTAFGSALGARTTPAHFGSMRIVREKASGRIAGFMSSAGRPRSSTSGGSWSRTSSWFSSGG